MLLCSLATIKRNKTMVPAKHIQFNNLWKKGLNNHPDHDGF